MKLMRALALVIISGAQRVALGAKASSNPLGATLELLQELAARIQKDGEDANKAYREYFQWCDDTAKNGQFAVEASTAEKEKLEAKIGALASDIEVSESKIDGLAKSVAKAEKELENATTLRNQEVAIFTSSEAELVDAVDTLSRAIGVLEKELATNPSVLVQTGTKDAAGAMQALTAVLDAAAFPGTDQKKLMALVQTQQAAVAQDEDDESEPGSPAVAAYESKSGGILDVLEDMKDKAEGQLSDLRKAEVNSKQNYDMLKQSLTNEIAADSKDLDQEKINKSTAEEQKAMAEGELETTTKALATATKDLADCRSTCILVAADHEASVAARGGELKTIQEVIKELKDATGGAVEKTYSFVQVTAGVQASRSNVAKMIKRLAKRYHSAALAQLASRVLSAVRVGASSREDPFGKVKGLIQDMIAKLTKQAGQEADEKAYCDEQMSKTSAKKSELEEDAGKLTAKLDQASAKSAELKEQISEIESQLATLAKEQAELDTIRQDEHVSYEEAKADLEKGLNGVRKALTVLRDYYAADTAAAQDESSLGAFMQQPAPPQMHEKSAGAGGSIIGLLEVVESDFAKNLAKIETEESDAQTAYEKITQGNKVTKASQEQDVKYKVQEAKSLDKTSSEISADLETTNTELAAVTDYDARIKERCLAKPDTYEATKARREAEIQGLKEALAALEQEAAFVQRRRHGSLRATSLRVS